MEVTSDEFGIAVAPAIVTYKNQPAYGGLSKTKSVQGYVVITGLAPNATVELVDPVWGMD